MPQRAAALHKQKGQTSAELSSHCVRQAACALSGGSSLLSKEVTLVAVEDRTFDFHFNHHELCLQACPTAVQTAKRVSRLGSPNNHTQRSASPQSMTPVAVPAVVPASKGARTG